MLRILIVEDEDFERKAIKYLINKHYSEGNFIVSEASNGKEALDLVLLFKPDIVLMDINMPIMNGLEACDRIKDINSEIEIIILTAYDEFDFAIRAIKSGTSDYLVKPFTNSEFLKSLNVSIDKVRRKRQQQLNQLHIIENYDKAIPFIEKELITQILYGDFSECCKMEESRKLLEIDNVVGCSILVGSKGKYTFQENALTALKNIFKLGFKKAVAARLLGDIIILIFDENVESIIMSNKMEDFISQAKKYFINQEGIEVEIGVGSIALNIDEFSDSYSKARLKLKNNLITLQHHEITGDNTTYVLNEVENNISEKLIGEDLHGAMEATKELEDSLLSSPENMDLNSYKLSLYNSLKNIRKNVMIFIDIDKYKFPNEMIKEELESLYTISDIHNYLGVFNNRLIKIISEYKNTNNMEIVNNAKEYIDKNYMKDIRLEDVAKEVCISSFYFSRIFKKYEGVNYIQYLTSVRMEKSKNLIIEDKLQIKEIAVQVGYVDQNYFSRVFKKYTGESPTEFSNNCRQYRLGGM